MSPPKPAKRDLVRGEVLLRPDQVAALAAHGVQLSPVVRVLIDDLLAALDSDHLHREPGELPPLTLSDLTAVTRDTMVARVALDDDAALAKVRAQVPAGWSIEARRVGHVRVIARSPRAAAVMARACTDTAPPAADTDVTP